MAFPEWFGDYLDYITRTVNIETHSIQSSLAEDKVPTRSLSLPRESMWWVSHQAVTSYGVVSQNRQQIVSQEYYNMDSIQTKAFHCILVRVIINR